MPSLRFHPLLIAGLAGLTLAACGGDDDPSPQAGAPAAQTESAAPAGTDAAKPPSDAPDGDGTPPGDQTAPGGPLDALENYAAGGAPATKKEAADVRATLIGFQEALGRRDPAGICNLTIGIPVHSTQKSPMSCTSLTQVPTEPPTAENRRLIAASKVIVNDDRATAEITAGLKMPLRKVDGRWRVDYGTLNRVMAAAQPSSR